MNVILILGLVNQIRTSLFINSKVNRTAVITFTSSRGPRQLPLKYPPSKVEQKITRVQFCGALELEHFFSTILMSMHIEATLVNTFISRIDF